MVCGGSADPVAIRSLMAASSLVVAKRRLWIWCDDIFMKVAGCYGVGWQFVNLATVSLLQHVLLILGW